MRGAPVSVIVPVRDGERYLSEAIDSILAQTAPAGEVLVVDDGSRDGSADVAAEFGPPVRCLRRDPLGIAAALNAGLAESRGDFVAMLDADDLWSPMKLELQLAAFERDPSLDLVFGHVEQFHSPELVEATRSRLHLTEGASRGLFKGAMLARREAIDSVGDFDGTNPLADFIDWYARAEDAALRTTVLPEVLLRRRIHGGNMTLREDRANYARAVRKILERRRAAAREEV